MLDDGLDPPPDPDAPPTTLPTIAALSRDERLTLATVLRMGGPRMLKPRRDGTVAVAELGVAIGRWYPDGPLTAVACERVLTVWGFDQRRIVVHGMLVTACRKALRELVWMLELPDVQTAHTRLARHAFFDDNDPQALPWEQT